jgi:hypothetical protein
MVIGREGGGFRVKLDARLMWARLSAADRNLVELSP